VAIAAIAFALHISLQRWLAKCLLGNNETSGAQGVVFCHPGTGSDFPWSSGLLRWPLATLPSYPPRRVRLINPEPRVACSVRYLRKRTLCRCHPARAGSPSASQPAASTSQTFPMHTALRVQRSAAPTPAPAPARSPPQPVSATTTPHRTPPVLRGARLAEVRTERRLPPSLRLVRWNLGR
jgi:hypothetical protein